MDKGNSALGPGDQPDADLEASSKRQPRTARLFIVSTSGFLEFTV